MIGRGSGIAGGRPAASASTLHSPATWVAAPVPTDRKSPSQGRRWRAGASSAARCSSPPGAARPAGLRPCAAPGPVKAAIVEAKFARVRTSTRGTRPRRASILRKPPSRLVLRMPASSRAKNIVVDSSSPTSLCRPAGAVDVVGQEAAGAGGRGRASASRIASSLPRWRIASIVPNVSPGPPELGALATAAPVEAADLRNWWRSPPGGLSVMRRMSKAAHFWRSPVRKPSDTRKSASGR